MATVAEQLRRAREERMLNVYQVAELTKIKTDHIRALEAGDYGIFSAPVYLRSFVRTYAKALRLDPHRLLRELEEELGQSTRAGGAHALDQAKGGIVDLIMLQLSRLNWRIVLATVAVGLVIVLTASALRNRARQKVDPLRDLGPGLYEPSPTTNSERLPLPRS